MLKRVYIEEGCAFRVACDIATHGDHFVRRPSVRPSLCPSVTCHTSHFPKLCFAGDTCIPRNAATIFHCMSLTFRKGVYFKSYFALLSLWVVGRQPIRICGESQRGYIVCVKERTNLVKYRSNIWHNLFNNEACQKALNLRNRKWSLAPTKLKTVRIKHMDRQ